MPHHLAFSRIHIIEWLWKIDPDTGQPDRRTGKELYAHIKDMIAEAKPPVDVMLHRVGSSKALLARIERIHQDYLTTRRVPIIQIDTHGDAEGIGLGEDGLTWKQLLKAFTPLNQSTGVKLSVFLSACKGMWGIEMAQAMDRAPFFALMGPKRDVYPGEVVRGLRVFYRTILVERDGLRAMDRMNSVVSQDEDVFRIYNCEQLFRNIWEWYLEGKTVEEIMARVFEQKLAERQAKRPMTDAEVTELRDYVSKYVRDYRPRFEESRRHFFMVDLYPQNDARFNLVLEPIAEGSETLRIAES